MGRCAGKRQWGCRATPDLYPLYSHRWGFHLIVEAEVNDSRWTMAMARIPSQIVASLGSKQKVTVI